jgi:hypothetical protein
MIEIQQTSNDQKKTSWQKSINTLTKNILHNPKPTQYSKEQHQINHKIKLNSQLGHLQIKQEFQQ